MLKKVEEFLSKVESKTIKECQLGVIFVVSAQLCTILINQDALNEFNVDGFGKEIITTLNNNGFYSLKGILEWEFIMKNNIQVLKLLCKS